MFKWLKTVWNKLLFSKKVIKLTGNVTQGRIFVESPYLGISKEVQSDSYNTSVTDGKSHSDAMSPALYPDKVFGVSYFEPLKIYGDGPIKMNVPKKKSKKTKKSPKKKSKKKGKS